MSNTMHWTIFISFIFAYWWAYSNRHLITFYISKKHQIYYRKFSLILEHEHYCIIKKDNNIYLMNYQDSNYRDMVWGDDQESIPLVNFLSNHKIKFIHFANISSLSYKAISIDSSGQKNEMILRNLDEAFLLSFFSEKPDHKIKGLKIFSNAYNQDYKVALNVLFKKYKKDYNYLYKNKRHSFNLNKIDQELTKISPASAILDNIIHNNGEN